MRFGQVASDSHVSGMNLFLDSNIYLGFYRLSDDDLEELRKLRVTVTEGATRLLLTEQVRDEFERNREKTIADALTLLDQAKLPKSYPRLFHNFSQYDELRDALEKYEVERGALLSAARVEASARRLRADQLIDELWDRVEIFPRNAEVLEAAHVRVRVGNPPGKRDSTGDAINWETLAISVPDGEDLLFVSADSDFRSPLNDAELNPFLAAEWQGRKKSSITLYKSLSSLFKEHYPDIKLASELERELAVGKLIGSGSFSSTHAAILDLSAYTDFSDAQVEALVEGANRNRQISWILRDPDVNAFFGGLLERYETVLDGEERNMLQEKIRAASDSESGGEVAGAELLDW